MKLSEHSAFPVDARRPFIGASSGSQLHVVTLAPSRRHTQHFALDEQGRVIGPVTSLPLARAESLGASADSVIVVGQVQNDGHRTVIRLHAGEIVWQDTVRIDRRLLVAPQLAVAGERALLVWAIEHEKSALCVAAIEADSIEETLQFEFDDFIFDLRALATEHALTVTCIHGTNTTSLELITIAEKAITQRVTIEDATRPVAPSLALAGNELVVFWITKPEHELRAQHFDETLQPLGPAALIASANGAEMRNARVFQGRDDRLALSYSTARQSDEWSVIPEQNEPDRYETAFTHEQFLGSYDYKARLAGEFQKLEGSSISYAASGWANDSLLLLSELEAPAISIYQ